MPTFFSKVLGFNSFKIKVKATACSPCGSRPVDVMLVLDRTGSMCQDSSGANDPACTDLNNAKAGIRTFLTLLRPEPRLGRSGRAAAGDECLGAL